MATQDCVMYELGELHASTHENTNVQESKFCSKSKPLIRWGVNSLIILLVAALLAWYRKLKTIAGFGGFAGADC